ncbi:unnamed protein product [Closterium sp. Naga37s-1]|nr:unnamed protein product [Closterium sp. Naga37s-1]
MMPKAPLVVAAGVEKGRRAGRKGGKGKQAHVMRVTVEAPQKRIQSHQLVDMLHKGGEGWGKGRVGLGESGLKESGLGESGLGESGLGESGLGESGLGESGLGESDALPRNADSKNGRASANPPAWCYLHALTPLTFSRALTPLTFSRALTPLTFSRALTPLTFSRALTPLTFSRALTPLTFSRALTPLTFSRALTYSLPSTCSLSTLKPAAWCGAAQRLRMAAAAAGA